MDEQPTVPRSPYGVIKLAAEHLCNLYASNWAVPTVSLRYFTVVGSRECLDVAAYRLIDAALSGRQFPMFGDGTQVRDFTHVSDIARTNLTAATAEIPSGTVANVAGGTATNISDIVAVVEELTVCAVRVERLPEQAGDVRRTGGSTALGRRLLGWEARVSLIGGIGEQVRCQRERRRLGLAPGVEAARRGR